MDPATIKKKKREDLKRVKALLKDAGYKLGDIAAELGVKPSTVTTVSQGDITSDRIEPAICEKVDRPKEDLWPTKYGNH